MNKFIKERQHIIFPVLDIALNGFNYFFHILISWYLIPDSYGILNSLLSLSAILLVTGVSFQTYTAKAISGGNQDKRTLINIFQISYIFAIVTNLILIIFINKIEQVTRGTQVEILVVMLIYLINITLSIFRGIFQGNKEFFNLNISFYIEVLFKMLFLIYFIKIYPNILIGLSSILIGMLISLIHSIYMNKKIVKDIFNSRLKIERNILNEFFEIFKIYLATFSFYFFNSIDMIIVNYYIPSKSGIYAVILKYTQISTFIATSIMTVFIPILNNVKENTREFQKMILKLFSIILGIGATGLVFYATIIPHTVKIFFGEKYLEASNFLFIGLLPYILLVLCYLVINIHIVLGNTKYILTLFIGAISITSALNFYHKNIIAIFYEQTIIYLVLFVILSCQIFAESKFKRRNGGYK